MSARNQHHACPLQYTTVPQQYIQPKCVRYESGRAVRPPYTRGFTASPNKTKTAKPHTATPQSDMPSPEPHQVYLEGG